jgi:hypothetical protein
MEFFSSYAGLSSDSQVTLEFTRAACLRAKIIKSGNARSGLIGPHNIN